jgi:hypothetical protein
MELNSNHASFPDVQSHIGDAPVGAGPQSIFPIVAIVAMDFGLALRASRNDDLPVTSR